MGDIDGLLIPAKAGHNAVRRTDMRRGGHFAAMEQPELLAEDRHSFYRLLRQFQQETRHAEPHTP